MDAVFYFHFYEPNNQVLSCSLALSVDNKTTGSFLDLVEFVQGSMAVQSRAYCELVRATSNTIGFRSSDILPDQYQQVMNRWRHTFSNRFNWCVSEVFDVTHVKDDQMFSYVKRAREQQQSELLRDMLNANISTSASTSAAKKI